MVPAASPARGIPGIYTDGFPRRRIPGAAGTAGMLAIKMENRYNRSVQPEQMALYCSQRTSANVTTMNVPDGRLFKWKQGRPAYKGGL